MAFAEEGNMGRSPDTRPAARGSGMPIAAGDHPGAPPGSVRVISWKTGRRSRMNGG
jgi:hypothetical protein